MVLSTTTYFDQQNTINKMADRVKETAKQEATRLRNIAEEGARSGAYLYPLKVSSTVILSI